MNQPTFPEYRIQAFWGGRPEDERACALRLATMLRTLENGPPAHRRWYRVGMTRRASSIPLLPVLEGRHGLIEFMKAGRHHTGLGHHLMEDLGFHIAAWNGLTERDGMSFTGTVGGATTPYRPPNFWNFSTSRFSDPSASVATAPVLRAPFLARHVTPPPGIKRPIRTVTCS
jgi:hypothetical protein